jgi:hypothetical protein
MEFNFLEYLYQKIFISSLDPGYEFSLIVILSSSGVSYTW